MTDSYDTDKRRSPRPTARASGPGASDAAPRPDADAPATEPTEERIAKVIARAGIASRRDAEALIAEGRVTLDGAVLDTPAINVGPDARITVDGEPLPLRERTRLWLFHKPRGLVTTARDPEGRTTVFEALPEDLPRVVAIGRLDINTEGLLLLTNDGGLAKVIAHPETGWTRRYRVRARGEVTQADLDRLGRGITVDGMEYGPIEANLDRVQGDNAWMTLALREGKNREVKRVLEHLGLQVNRLIRLSFGPFQLGELEAGLVEEVRTRVLKDQLGQALATEAGVDFESPVREPIAPFGSPKGEAPGKREGAPRRDGGAERAPRSGPPRPRRPGDDAFPRGGQGAARTGFGGARSFGDRDARPGGGGRPGTGSREGWQPRPDRESRPGRPERQAPGPDGSAPRGRDKGPAVWRQDEGEARPAKRHIRRDDPQADRAASAGRQRERVGAVESRSGSRVLVERVKPSPPREERAPRDERPRREDRPQRDARPQRDTGPRGGAPDGGAGARSFAPRGEGRRDDNDRPRSFGPPKGRASFGDKPGGFGGKPGGFRKPDRAGGGRFDGKPGGFGARSEGAGERSGGRPGGKPGGFGGKPGGFGGKPGGFGSKPGGFGGKPGGFGSKPGGFGGKPGGFKARPGGGAPRGRPGGGGAPRGPAR